MFICLKSRLYDLQHLTMNLLPDPNAWHCSITLASKLVGRRPPEQRNRETFDMHLPKSCFCAAIAAATSGGRSHRLKRII